MYAATVCACPAMGTIISATTAVTVARTPAGIRAEPHAAADPRMAPPGEYPVILADYATGRGDRNLEMGRAVCHEQSRLSGWLLLVVLGSVAVREGVDAGGREPVVAIWKCSPAPRGIR